jgi:hypothetical protein
MFKIFDTFQTTFPVKNNFGFCTKHVLTALNLCENLSANFNEAEIQCAHSRRVFLSALFPIDYFSAHLIKVNNECAASHGRNLTSGNMTLSHIGKDNPRTRTVPPI